MDSQLTDFEQIAELDPAFLAQALAQFPTAELVKAAMGASPAVNALLERIRDGAAFAELRLKTGPVRIEEVEALQRRMLNAVNEAGR